MVSQSIPMISLLVVLSSLYILGSNAHTFGQTPAFVPATTTTTTLKSQSTTTTSSSLFVRGGAAAVLEDDDMSEVESSDYEDEEEEDNLVKSAQTKVTKAAKKAVASGLAASKPKKKKKKSSLVKLFHLPYIVGACMNPFVMFQMIKGYWTSLFNLNYVKDNTASDPSANLRTALQEKAKRATSNGPRGKRKMKPGQAKTLSDLPQLNT